MKRILHIVGVMDRAGAETMIMNLYRTIDRNKFQFDFVYFTEKECAFDKEIMDLGGAIYRIPEDKSKNIFTRTLYLFKELKAKKTIHAVHCHQLLSNGFHLLAAYLAGIQIRVAHAHSTKFTGKKNVLSLLYIVTSKTLIKLFSTDRIACGTEAGYFLFGSKNDFEIIPNGLDVSNFANSEEKRKLNFFNLPNFNQDTPVLCQIGRFMPVKNHIFTLELARTLKSSHFDFHLFFAGNGPEEEKLKNYVIENDLTDYITFLGVRDDIDWVLANADLMLMPSLYEGFPVILVEAQAAGCPSLISDTISDEVDFGLGLIHFASLNDPKTVWMENINHILKMKKPEAKIRNALIVENGFDIEQSVERIERIYEKEII